MTRAARTAGCFLAAAFLLVGGCKKEYRITFVNTTSESLDVTIVVAGYGGTYVGRVGADGGKLPARVKLDKDELPAHCSWRANGFGDSFTLTEDMEKDQWIDIEPGGESGPRDENVEKETETHIEIHDIPSEPTEVVE